MTTNSLLRVMATALVFMAACKSDFQAGSYNDGGVKDVSATCTGVTPKDEQSCVNATCVPHCDSPPIGLVVSSAPGGPLLADVRVTNGPCFATACPRGCETINVSNGLRSFDVTCDLVAVSTDGRSQSFRVGIVRLGSPTYWCCGASGFGVGPGQWVESTATAFDPPQVVVDFNRDGGVPEAGAGRTDGAPTNDGGLNIDGVSAGPAKPDGLNLAGLTALTVTTTGGMIGPSPGDACGSYGTNVYSLDLQTRVLSWEHCATDPSTANAYRKTESQQLTDLEITAVRLMLDQLSTNYDRTSCGFDKEIETLDLTFGDRIEKYQDDFYAGCSTYVPADGRTYLHYMDGIMWWLRNLSWLKQFPGAFSEFTVYILDTAANLSPAAGAAAQAACSDNIYPTYTVTAATRELAWSSCVSPNGLTGYTLQTGKRILDESEFALVMQSWSRIELGATGDCSTPRATERLYVTTAGTYAVQFGNDFTACNASVYSSFAYAFVVGLDDLAALLASLANGSSPSDAGVSDSGPTKPDGLNLAGLTALTVTSDPLTYGTYPPLCPLTGTSRKDIFSLDLGTRVFNWDYCSFDFSTRTAYQAQAARQLTDLELTAVRLMLEQLSTNYNRTTCGWDKEIETLDLTFGDRIEKYQDDFYGGCSAYVPADGRTYLHYMDGIVWWLRNLSWLTEFPRTFTDIVVGVPYPSKTASAAAVADATAACGDTNTKYTLTSTTREFAWSSCVSPNGLTGHKLQTGTRILSDSEFALVLQSWSQIQLGATGDCSTPRPTESLHVTAASAMLSDFANDFTACNRPDNSSSGTSTYVVGLDDLTALLASLAK